MQNLIKDLSLPFLLNKSSEIKTLHKILVNTGFRQDSVIERLSGKEIPTMKDEDIPELLYRTNGGTSLDTLIRLFLMEAPVDQTILEKVFPAEFISTLVKAGMLYEKNGSLITRVKIIPFQNLHIAFDSPTLLRSAEREQYVMGIGASTLTLANLTVRSTSKATLDLGTGCGFHAFFAAPHSDRVVALDLNPRAVQYAQFNARLNNLDNIETLAGDLFVPLEGQKFDLIVSNPPFVISPESEYIYRDGGMPGDTLIQKIVNQAPIHLNEGGFCQILCNWAEPDGQKWQERLRMWFKDSGCDVWILRSESRDAAIYASTWIRHTEKAAEHDYSSRFDRWLTYFKQEGITSVGAGCIIMRKRSGKTWFSADEAPEKINTPCGEHIKRGFYLRDFLNAVPDDATLLKTKLRPAPELTLERISVPDKTGWRDSSIQAKLQSGLKYIGNLDPVMARFIMETDNNRTLEKHLKNMAKRVKQPPESLHTPFCKIVRGLIEKGFLLPEGIRT